MNHQFNAALTESRFGCSMCSEVFGSVTGFDMHQKNKGTKRVSCKLSSRIGLDRDSAGVWRLPASGRG